MRQSAGRQEERSRKPKRGKMMKIQIKEALQRVKNGNDVRGIVMEAVGEPVTLTEGMVQLIADSFLTFLEKKCEKKREALRIGVGHDSRVSAMNMKSACFQGLGGAEAFDCGLITTPAMFQSVLLPESGFDGAVMLTASHLPFNRNGMKFFTSEGALSGSELGEILDLAAEAAIALHGADAVEDLSDIGGAKCAPARTERFDMKGLYCEHMKQRIREKTGAAENACPLEGLHLVVDAGNGAAGFFATEILKPLGADISGSVFLDPDGTFPNHVPNPEDSEAMRAVKAATLSANADLGIIFDCDGDRAAVVFSDGTEVNRNALIALLSTMIAEEHPGSWIVTDSVTSDELSEFLTDQLKLRHLRFRRGYKHVIDRGIRLNREGECCELAIETSGHGAFRENHFSDDGAYIAMKIICLMANLKKEGKRIEDRLKALTHPEETVERRYQITVGDFRGYGEHCLSDFDRFIRESAHFTAVEPNYEGVRAAYENGDKRGWVLLRLSLHDPVMPMNAEARKAGTLDTLLAELEPFFSAHPELREKK